MPVGSNRLGFWYNSVAPQPDFPNPGFELGFQDWTALNQRIFLNGGSTILGYPTPTDPTPNPSSGSGTSPGDGFSFQTGPSFSVTLSNNVPPDGETTSATLSNNGVFVSGGQGAIFYGPALVSDYPVVANVGDTIQFQWFSTSDTDAYNIFAYGINPLNGNTLLFLDANATAPGTGGVWNTSSTVIAPGQAGIYHFVFICGSFDATFGLFVGSTLRIDNIRLIKA
jgi:hypothetical protein